MKIKINQLILFIFCVLCFCGCISNSKISAKEQTGEIIDNYGMTLVELNKKIKDSETDPTDIPELTENYIEVLKDYLKNSTDLQYVHDNEGINLITENFNKNEFNLICYDGNAIGFGTLERTWTFLQVIKDGKIELYLLYNESAEYPLKLKILESNNENIIAIAGVTNMSRSHTAFLSFWIYGDNGFNKYTNIQTNSNLINDSIIDNEYFTQYFEDNIQIVESEDGFFKIIGSQFSINTYLSDDSAYIEIKDN